MLTIRLQRSGRTGHAQFRVIVQDGRAHPTSGRVVAYVGNYNPHTKIAVLDKEKISTYLGNGAVPSDRTAKLLIKEGMKLPKWYKAAPSKEKTVRNPEKRRSTRPEGEPMPEPTLAESTETDPTQGTEATEPGEAPAAQEPTAEAGEPVEDKTPEAPEETDPKTEEPTESEPTPDAEAPAEAPEAESAPAKDAPTE